MSTGSEKVNNNNNNNHDGSNVVESTEEAEESTLQQLKAKKNKSNLFLIKSYSFIERNNNNNNNNSINNNNNLKMSRASVPLPELLFSPDMEAFPDIASLVLAQDTADSQANTKKNNTKQKQKQPKVKTKTKAKSKWNKTKLEQEQEQRTANGKGHGKGQQEEPEPELDEQEAQLLRRHNAHEYEELLEHLPAATHGSLPRPQSLPAKVLFDTAASSRITIEPISLDPTPIPAKRRSGNIKRESFLRQSLQSIRRSFGSNKHSNKLSIGGTSAGAPTVAGAGASSFPSPASSNASTTSSTSSSAVSFCAPSSCSSAAAISMLTKAQAHNHILDEYLPTPVVLLLKDERNLALDSDYSDALRLTKRSTSSVINTVANANGGNSGISDERASTSMAPLQLPATGASATATGKDSTSSAAASAAVTATTTTATATPTLREQQRLLQQQQQLEQLQQRRQQYCQQLSLPETFGLDEDSSLPQSYNSSGAPLQSSGSAHSLGSSPSPSPRSSQGKGGAATAAKGFNTAKQHDQQAAAAAASSSATAAAVAAAGVPATGTTTTAPTTTGASNAAAAAAAAAAASSQQPDKDKEKEKKRKEVSSSRVKKFHRHFSQVSKDEKLINYFSCALVGDIPLQGHLYITDVHFAFYSNVFGYVTKVVIPTSSVTKISKEKTAKIIPNAVGVAAGDERHVFGSFISREAAFRLMCTVCSQLNNGMEILPKPLPLADVDLTEEYLLDDDSSCSISGNESPPHMRDAAAAAAAAVAAGAASEPEMSLRQRDRHSDLAGKSAPSAVEHGQVTIRSSAPPIVHYEEPQQHVAATTGSRLLSSTSPSLTAPPSSSSSLPITIATVTSPTVSSSKFSSLGHSLRSRMRLQLPTLTELHVLYLGIMLAIMLALFSVFLLYRILDIEAKTNLYNTPVDFNVRSGNDEDIFAEALRWQKELQDKSTAEAQHILSKNLEQISKVRRSLETLSMLIHDRRAGFVQPAATEAAVAAVANSAAAAAVLEPELDASPVGAASSDILSD